MDSVFWISSKLIWEIFSPDRFLLLLLFLGVALLWTKHKNAGRWLLANLSIILFLVTFLPVSNILLLPLENRFQVPLELPEQVDGIIVLGGSEDTRLTMARGQPVLYDSAERLTMFVSLAKRYPNAQLVFAGGSGQITGQEYKESFTARMLFYQLGLNVERVVFESSSRHTAESSTLSYQIVRPKLRERWILIGSAFRMPRAFGAYKNVGWNIIPYPVDFKTSGKLDFDIDSFSFSGLERVSLGIREWLGLLAYWLSGKTEDLFPSHDV
jgi:uncharacterized SAM-binding protein YcdF (DUF218 family)